MGLLSALSQFAKRETDITGKKLGFLAYGSGSKAKVFEGTLQSGWKTAAEKARLFDILNENTSIGFNIYLRLHKKEQKQSVLEPKNEWVLDRIEKEIPNLIGARYYKWVE